MRKHGDVRRLGGCVSNSAGYAGYDAQASTLIRVPIRPAIIMSII